MTPRACVCSVMPSGRVTYAEFCCDERSYSNVSVQWALSTVLHDNIHNRHGCHARNTLFSKRHAAKRSVEKDILELQIPSLCDCKDSCMTWSIYAELFVCLCPLTDRLALDWQDKWLKEWCGDSGPGSWLWPVGAPAVAPPLGPRR